MKVRIKAGDAVELVERSLRAFRKGLKFRLWQIPETQLYGSQFVKDHVDRSRETPPFCASRRRISRNCYHAY
jgi:hypothetical protein